MSISQSTIRRVYSSGNFVLEWGDGLKATISLQGLMIEAEAKGLFGRETSLGMLQATLHDPNIDSTGETIVISSFLVFVCIY